MKNHLTPAQADLLLTALRGHPFEAIITLALATGMRRDELLHVRWQDLDLEHRKVRVLNSKTQHGERVLPFSESLSSVLTQHAVRQEEARLQAGPAWQNHDLVFPDPVGGALAPESLLQGWYDLLEQAQLPRFRFHELRVARWRALTARVRAEKEGRDGALLHEFGTRDAGDEA